MTNVDGATLKLAQAAMLSILIEIDKVCRKHGIQYWLDCGTLLGAYRHSGFIPWDDDVDIAMLREDFDRFNEIAREEFDEKFFIQNRSTDPHYYKLNFPCKVRLNNTFIEEIEYRVLPDKARRSHFGLYVDVFPVDRYSCHRIPRTLQRMLSLLIYCKTIGIYTRHYTVPKLLCATISRFVPVKVIDILKKAQLRLPWGSLLGFGIEMPFTMGYFSHADIFPLGELQFEGHYFPVPRDVHHILALRYGEGYMQLPALEERHTHAICIQI